MKQDFRLINIFDDFNLVKGVCHIHDSHDQNRFLCELKVDKILIGRISEKLYWLTVCRDINGLLCTVEFNEIDHNALPVDGIIIKIDGFQIC